MNAGFLDTLITLNPDADAPTLLGLAHLNPCLMRSISAADLNPWLGNNGLTPRLKRTAAYISSLSAADARSMLQLPSEMTDLAVNVATALTADQLDGFTDYAASGEPFATDTLLVASKVVKLLALARGLNDANPTLGVTQAEAAALIALGGGYQTFDAVLDDVTAALAKRALAASYLVLTQQANTIQADAATLHQQRTWKIQRMLKAGTTAPADLTALDAAPMPQDAE
jgi:hypothetical protein